MVNTLGLLVKQLKIRALLDCQWLLKDTRTFIVDVCVDLVGMAASISGLFLLAQRYDGLGGFNRDQVVFMLGFGLVVEGLNRLFFGGENAGMPSRRFGRGQIDHMMIKPVPIWIQLITDGFSPASGCWVLLAGLGVVHAPLKALGIVPTAVNALAFATQAFAALGVLVGFQYLCAVPALYAPVAAEEVSTTVEDFFLSLRNFPLGGLHGALRTLLCTALPVGLVAYLPTAALLGIEGALVWATPLAAVLIITLAALLVARGMRYYATVGAIRYSNRGFR